LESDILLNSAGRPIRFDYISTSGILIGSYASLYNKLVKSIYLF